MNAEQLNIKVKVDISDLKKSVEKIRKDFTGMGKEVGKSLPVITTESKKAERSLDGVSDATDDITKNLKEAGEEATKAMAKIKGLKTGINVGEGVGNSLNIKTDGIDNATVSLEELKSSLQNLTTLSALDLFIENWGKVKDIFDASTDWYFGPAVDNATESVKDFGKALKGLITGKWKDALANLKKSIKGIKLSFENAKYGLKDFANGISSLIPESIKKMGKLLAVVTAVVVAIRNALGISKIGDEIYNNAQMAGMSADFYQKWAYQLERVGVQADELKEIVKTLTEAQIDVINGSKDMISAFEQLGITQQEVIGMNQQQLFERTVGALQKVENQTQRTAIAYKLFSEDATKLTQVLNMSAGDAARLSSLYDQLGGHMSQNLINLSAQARDSMHNLKTAFMGIRNALAEALLPAIITVINWLTKAMAIIGMFLRAIFGIELKASSGGKGITGGMVTGAKAAKSYTGAVDSATKAVEKFRRATMGFDELNILPGKDSNSGSSSPLASGGTGAADLPNYGAGFGAADSLIPVEDLGLEKIQAWIEKYRKLIQDLVVIGLTALGIGMVIAGAVGGFNIPLILKGIGLASLGISIGMGEGNTWDRHWTALKKGLSNLAKDVKSWWKGLANWYNTDVKPIFTKAYWSKQWEIVKTTIGGELSAIGTTISNGWAPIKQWFGTHVGPVFTKAWWSAKFDTVKQGASEKLGTVKTTLSGIWTGVTGWFSSNVAPKFTKTYWSNKFDTIRSAVSDKVGSAISTVQSKWNSMKSWYNSNIAPKFTTSYWSSKFSAIPNGIKSAFNSAISIVERAINAIVGKVNTLKINIPDWVPSYGGKSLGFSLKKVTIPRLATGGIVTQSTIANIGEAGKEAVLPLERNTQWMDALADKIASRNSAPTTLILQVDGQELGRTTINNINNITRQTGELQLILG